MPLEGFFFYNLNHLFKASIFSSNTRTKEEINNPLRGPKKGSKSGGNVCAVLNVLRMVKANSILSGTFLT